MKSIATILLLVTLGVRSAHAQDISMSHIMGETSYESPSCTSVDHHEMDFMHGIWDLKVLVDERWVEGGFSVHRSALGGCASLEFVSYENWGEIFVPLTGRNGLAEITISTYDVKTKNWQQVWVDDTGTVVTNFRGKRFTDGMRFVGHAPSDNGSELQRIVWKITGEGLREVTFDQSTDGGQDWTRMATVQMVLRQ